MNGVQIATLVVASAGFLTSAVTLTIVLVAGQKMQEEVEEVRETANGTVRKIKNALDGLEF